MLAEQLAPTPVPKQLQNQGNANRTMGSETFHSTIAEPTKCKQHHGPTLCGNSGATPRQPAEPQKTINPTPNPKPKPYLVT